MKTIFKLAMLSMAMTFSFSSCQTDDDPVNNLPPLTKADSEWFVGERTWNYPFTDFSTDEAQQFMKEHPYPEIYDYFNVPEDLLSKMSTAELVQLCADFPWNDCITDFNYYLAFYNNLTGYQFHGYDELYKRKDNAEVLYEYFKWSVERARSVLDSAKEFGAFDNVDVLTIGLSFGREEVLQNLTETQMDEILKWAISCCDSSDPEINKLMEAFLRYPIVAMLNYKDSSFLENSPMFSGIYNTGGWVGVFNMEHPDEAGTFIDKIKELHPELF